MELKFNRLTEKLICFGSHFLLFCEQNFGPKITMEQVGKKLLRYLFKNVTHLTTTNFNFRQLNLRMNLMLIFVFKRESIVLQYNSLGKAKKVFLMNKF